MNKIALLLAFVFAVAMFPAPTYAACDGYTVKSGDTLTRIAKANQTTYLELARLNNIASPYRIFVGQCLRLPISQTVPAVTPIAAASSDAKGLAMPNHHTEDLATLGIKWYYNWQECSLPCTTMVRAMQLPRNCEPIILVGNEPNAVEPYGAPVTPADAVVKVKAIEAQCPNSKLVVGNVSVDNWGSGTGRTWLLTFLQAYPDFKQALGVHCYTQHSGQWCIDQLKSVRSIYAGEMWVTEFGILSGDATQFKLLLDYVAANFTRYAAYTNRQPHTGQGWEIATGVELVNNDGSLSPIGIVYSKK